MQYPIIDLIADAYINNGWTGLDSLSILPSGYTELDYIESSGTQYIDTGIYPNGHTKIEMYGSILSLRNGNNQIYNARGNNKYYGLSDHQTYYNLYYGSNWSNGTKSLLLPYDIYCLQDGNVINITANNTLYTITRPYTNFTSDYTLYIFGANNAGSLYESTPKMRLSSFKIWEDGDILTRNYIPCKQNSDNTCGLYDITTNTYYGNNGTDVFIPGTEQASGIDINSFICRLKLPLPYYFPHPVIDALQRAAAGTQTADDTEILRHYLTPLGIGGI